MHLIIWTVNQGKLEGNIGIWKKKKSAPHQYMTESILSESIQYLLILINYSVIFMKAELTAAVS